MKLLPSLKQLEYLTALADTEHFGQAADLCNVTPSTLSAGIRDLEDLLGVSVAERTKRTVLMTPIGRDIAARAHVLIRDAEDIMDLCASQSAPLCGDLRLGVIPTIGPYLLPRILPGLTGTYPALKLYLKEAQTEDLLAMLRRGEIDTALMALPYDIDEFAARELLADRFIFVCPQNHPFAEKKVITPADLAAQPLLLLEEGHCLRGHALDACMLNPGRARAQFEATSLPTLVQMVAAGIGVTLLPELAVDAEVSAASGIRLIPLADNPSRQIGLVWRTASPRAGEFEALGQAIVDQSAG